MNYSKCSEHEWRSTSKICVNCGGAEAGHGARPSDHKNLFGKFFVPVSGNKDDSETACGRIASRNPE